MWMFRWCRLATSTYHFLVMKLDTRNVFPNGNAKHKYHTNIERTKNWMKNNHKSLHKLKHSHQRNRLISLNENVASFSVFRSRKEDGEKKERRKKKIPIGCTHQSPRSRDTYFFWHLQLFAEATANGRQFAKLLIVLLLLLYFILFVHNQRQRVGCVLALCDGNNNINKNSPKKKKK